MGNCHCHELRRCQGGKLPQPSSCAAAVVRSVNERAREPAPPAGSLELQSGTLSLAPGMLQRGLGTSTA